MIYSCDKNDPVVEETVPDEIELSQTKDVDITNGGGSFDVTVTSSKQWNLKCDAAWIRHSACYGESGDAVTFTVDKNNSTTARKADIIFVVGEKTAKFTVKQGQGANLEISGDDTYRVSHLENTLEVTLTGNAENLSFASTTDNNWVSLTEADNTFGNGTTFRFNVSANTTGAERSTVLTFNGDYALPVQVTVNQEPEPSFTTEKAVYNIGAEAQNLDIIYTTNIGVSVSVNMDWIEYLSKDDGTFKFRVNESPTDLRGATITFTYDFNPEYTYTVKVNQISSSIQYAADFTCDIFRNWVIAKGWLLELGDGMYVVTEEGKNATVLDHNSSDGGQFTSVSGIENFPGLTTVKFNNDNFTACDISALKKVTDFDIKGLSFGALELLNLGDNMITSFGALNAGYAVTATSFTLSSRHLRNADFSLSGYPAVYNKMATLDVTGCPALSTLNVSRGQKTPLTIKKKKGQNITITSGDTQITVEEAE